MASTMGPTPEDAATRQLLAERYGTGRRRSGRIAMIVGLAVSVLFLSWLGWATWDHARPVLSSEFVGFTVLDTHRVEARFDVRRKDDQATGTCVLRALAEDHSLVGELRVPIEPSDRLQVRMTRVIQTEREATSVELQGCTAPGQVHPR